MRAGIPHQPFRGQKCFLPPHILQHSYVSDWSSLQLWFISFAQKKLVVIYLVHHYSEATHQEERRSWLLSVNSFLRYSVYTRTWELLLLFIFFICESFSVSHSFLCSHFLVWNTYVHPVYCQMLFQQSLHFILFGLVFGWTSSCLSMMWGSVAVFMLFWWLFVWVLLFYKCHDYSIFLAVSPA